MQASNTPPAENPSLADRPAIQTIRVHEIRRPGSAGAPQGSEAAPLTEKQALWVGDDTEDKPAAGARVTGLSIDVPAATPDALPPEIQLRPLAPEGEHRAAEGHTPHHPAMSPAPATRHAQPSAAGMRPAAAPRPGLRDTRREDHENNKLSKRLHRLAGQAIADFDMIGEGDRVMVCLSGGKDSFGMLDILLGLQKRAPVRFSIVAVNLDQRQPGFPADVLPTYLQKLGVEYHIETEDTYSTVQRVIPDGKTKCSLCSRLRRGILYRVADELGATRIALGHHRDDILATFFLNIFYGGQLKTMPAKLVSDDGRHVVIRPLAYVKEKDLIRWAEVQQYPIIPCNLCGSQPNLKRAETREMLRLWEKRFPGRLETIFSSLGRVRPSHLMDRTLYDFNTLRSGDDAED